MTDAIVVDRSDAEANKGMAVLAYLGYLAIIPFFAARQSPFVRFHLNQSVVLFVIAHVCMVPISCVSCGFALVPFVGVFMTTLILVAVLAGLGTMMGIGIQNALNLRTEKLPGIGDLFVALR